MCFATGKRNKYNIRQNLIIHWKRLTTRLARAHGSLVTYSWNMSSKLHRSHTQVTGHEQATGDARVTGHAHLITDQIIGHKQVTGHAQVTVHAPVTHMPQVVQRLLGSTLSHDWMRVLVHARILWQVILTGSSERTNEGPHSTLLI